MVFFWVNCKFRKLNSYLRNKGLPAGNAHDLALKPRQLVTSARGGVARARDCDRRSTFNVVRLQRLGTHSQPIREYHFLLTHGLTGS